MKNYIALRELFSFSSGISVQEAEKEIDRSPALVAQFPHRDGVDVSVYDRAWKSIDQLGNIARLLMPLEMESGSGDFACEMAFDWPGELQPLSKIVKNGEPDLWVMRSATEVLEDLYIRRVHGQYIGEDAIWVDEENYAVHLGFVGLSEVFLAHDELNGSRGQRMDWRDDVNRLARYFEKNISKLPQSESADVVESCMSGDASQRPKTSELLQAMRKMREFHPCYEHKVDLKFSNNFTDAEVEDAIGILNQHDCYHTEWRRGERDGKLQRKCDFFVGGYKGVFINREGDEHWFIPEFFKKSAIPQGGILRAQFCRIIHSRPAFSMGKNYYHHLTSLGEERSDAVKNWRLVPEKEKAFIEEHSFKEAYQHCYVLSKGKKLSFILRADATPDWQKVNDLKEKEKQLDVVPMYVGDNQNKITVGCFDDFQQRWVLRVESDRNDIPHSGGMKVEGVPGNLEFLFYWREQGTLCFGVKEWNEGKWKQLSRKDVAVFIDGANGRVGTLINVSKFPEIITRDFDSKSRVHETGKLCEDVGSEIAPLKRQIESVRAFELNDIAEPQLGSILATPKEHKPPAIPSAAWDIKFFDEDLDESQKNAVVGALFQKPLFLIHGPPGTGKTTVIVELIRQIMKMNSRARILVCSQTNLAVDNVMERLPDEKGLRKVRLARDKKKVMRTVQNFHFDNRFEGWKEDTIRRGNEYGKPPRTAMEKAFAKSRGDAKTINPKQRNRIDNVVKKWHQFLRNKDAEIRANVEGGWSSLEMAFLRSMNIVGATCVHMAAGRYRPIFGDRYDYLIMDEAGKATPAETLIPVVRAKRVVLIGDHKQLPPFVTAEPEVWEKAKEDRPELEDAEDENLRKIFGESLFEKLIKGFSGEKPVQEFLSIQRRMPNRLGELISKYFYDEKLKNPVDSEFARSKNADLPVKWQAGVLFINTGGKKNPHDNGESNWRQNTCNSDVVTETLRLLSQQLPSSCEISVIAGYRGQVALLRQRIRESGCLKGKPDDLINTVDGFQGRESDVVIYDFVRSSPGHDTVGFLDEPRRLNVALSRAKKLLIIIGDANFLSSRAKPGKDRRNKAKKPILGEIVDELAAENLVFNSLNESLQ